MGWRRVLFSSGMMTRCEACGALERGGRREMSRWVRSFARRPPERASRCGSGCVAEARSEHL